MTKAKFYWECLGQEYRIDPNKKYLVYFKGAFSPPHRGHYGMVERFSKFNNVHVMIHQMKTHRHGVPYELNRKIWKTYINELLPKNRIHLVKYKSLNDIYNLVNNINFDKIIYIRGNEKYNIFKTERSTLSRFDDIMNRTNVGFDFFYVDRPHVKTLSATKFVRELINNKNKRCYRKYCNCKYKKLKYFFPENLPQSTAINIINKLQRHYLSV